jgi:hypothetical protein
MAVTASFGAVTSRDRSVNSIGRVGSRLVRHLLIGSAATATIGIAVAVAVGWSLSTLSTTKHDGSTRGHFGLRRIALAPLNVNTATRPGPADIIVFPFSVADAARPAPVATRKIVRSKGPPIPPTMPQELARLRTELRVAAIPPVSPPAPEKQITAQRTDDVPVSTTAQINRTAVYDISARAVYLPNGKTLEAHSGLGNWRDNPRYVGLKMRGPTPPNTYDLSLREKLFHGVRAIRLTPVEDDKMFGRDGMLAHTYMLGPRGDSNGCVSFKNYSAFLQAYLNGDIDRLIVVPRHGAAVAHLARTGTNRGARYAANSP